MKRIVIFLALCLSIFAQAQDTITIEDTGGFISKLVYDWTSDGAGAATGRTTAVVPGILFGIATTPDTVNVPTDLYDVVVKQAFTNTSSGVTVLAADLTAGAVANRSSTVVQWTEFWPTSILNSGGFIQIEVTNAGATKEGRIEFYVYRTLAIIPEGGNGLPLGGVTTQLLQNSGNGVAKWITMSGDATIADGGNLQLVDPLPIEGLTMTGILTTGTAPTTVTNADGTIKLSALETGGGDIIGTTNQVVLTGSGVDQILGANLTLGLPQDIHTGANVTFANITGTGILTMGSAPTTLTNADGTLIVSALSTGADILGTANQVTVSSGTGTLIGGSDATLSLPNIVNLGVNDTTFGQMTLFGSSGTISGAILRLHNAASDDTDVNYWEVTTGGASVGPFEIKDDGGTAVVSISDTTFDMTLSNELNINGTGTSTIKGDWDMAKVSAKPLLSLNRDQAVTLNMPLGEIRFGGIDPDQTSLDGFRLVALADEAFAAASTGTRGELYTIPVGSGAEVLNWTFESDADFTLDGGGDLTLTGGKLESTAATMGIESENVINVDVDSGADTILSAFNLTGEGGTVPLLTALSDSEQVILFGTVADGKAKTLSLTTKGGTDDVTGAANVVALYAVDITASAELHAIDEAGNATVLTPHNFSGIPGGPSEDMAWSYHSRRGEKTISVDMLRVIRLLEELTGETLVFEGNVEEIQNRVNPKKRLLQSNDGRVSHGVLPGKPGW